MFSSFEKLLFDHVWIAVLLWIGLFLSDYWLTLQGAKLREKIVHIIDWEGSYELTTNYQKDVNKGRFGFAAIFALWFYGLVIWILWAVAVSQKLPQLFSCVMGAFLLTEIPIHWRHAQNIFSFKSLQITGAATGEIHYSRWLGLRLSAISLLSFAVVFLVLFLMTESWFFPGGALMCFITGVQQWRKSSRLMRSSLATQGFK
jgi:hypothetical protein